LEVLEVGEEIHTIDEFNMHLDKLTGTILEGIDAKMPKIKPLPYQKQWWSKELAKRWMEVCRLTCRGYNKRSEPDDAIHHEQKAIRKAYGVMIKCMKRCHWEESVDEGSVWTVHQYALGDQTGGGRACVLTLKSGTKTAPSMRQKQMRIKAGCCGTLFSPGLRR